MTNYDIEKAIMDLFCGANSPMRFKAIDIQRGVSALSRPGMTVAAISGAYEEKDGSGMLTETVRVVVTLVFKNVTTEEERRKEAHPSVKYVVRKLSGNNLGLDIEPMTVKNWKDVSTDENLMNKLTVIEIEFETLLSVTPESAEEDYRELESIWSSFKSETAPNEELMESKVNFDNGENQ